MPVPKDKEKLYGMIVGKNINEGKSLEASKNIADRAIIGKKDKASSNKKCKICGKQHTSEWHQ